MDAIKEYSVGAVEPELNNTYVPLSSENLTTEEYASAYNQYAEAMSRRRPGQELSEEAFYDYIASSDVAMVKHGKSFVFGHCYGGTFIPSHFAPASMREGTQLIRKLKRMGCVLAVTDDLAVMAKKLGFIVFMDNYPCRFRGETVMKTVLVSDQATQEKVARFLEA